MSDGPTYCDTCRHIFQETKSSAPWYWMCQKHKRCDGYGFVMRGAWVNKPPYLYCRDVNGGACPLYEPIGGTNAEKQEG